ncbi:MAG: hypothetical protein IIA45_06795 [Bacteroidetes bacterium]|nr:hypothetical protein [Bacteroidota bacterium]
MKLIILLIVSIFVVKVAVSQQTNLPNDTVLYNVAANGFKFDMIFLTKELFVDHSGWDYLVEYKPSEFDERKKVVGKADLILGNMRFHSMNEDLKYSGISAEALKLLSEWILDNRE